MSHSINCYSPLTSKYSSENDYSIPKEISLQKVSKTKAKRAQVFGTGTNLTFEFYLNLNNRPHVSVFIVNKT